MARNSISLANWLATLNIRDPMRVLSVAAYAFNYVTASGGATTLSGYDFCIVLDGSPITLPAAPSDGTKMAVVSKFSGVSVQVSPSGSDKINNSTNPVQISQPAVMFTYSAAGTNWTTT